MKKLAVYLRKCLLIMIKVANRVFGEKRSQQGYIAADEILFV
jgi:hypothetical protein